MSTQKILFVLSAVGSLFLSGCGGKTWTHPTKSESQFHADSLSCQQMAMQMHPEIKSQRMPVNNLPPSSYQTNCYDYGATINCNTQAVGGGPDPYAIGYNSGAAMGESLGNMFRGIAMENTFDKCLMSKGYRPE